MTAIDVGLIAKLTRHVPALGLVNNWAWDLGKFDICSLLAWLAQRQRPTNGDVLKPEHNLRDSGSESESGIVSNGLLVAVRLKLASNN